MRISMNVLKSALLYSLMFCSISFFACQSGEPKSGQKPDAKGEEKQSSPEAKKPAEKPKVELIVYTALEDDELSVYRNAYEAAHPNVDIKIVRDSTGIISAKLLAEKNNPRADVIWGLAATSLLQFDQKGMLAGYAPKGIERLKKGFKDTKNTPPHWVGIKAWMTGIIGNTIEMKTKMITLPDSYEALTKPEYKGLIALPNPASSGTGYMMVSAILQTMGEEKGWDFLDRLHKNVALYTHSGSKPAKMAGRGEYPIGISLAYRGFKQMAAGEPLEVAFPKEGCGWDMEANALVRKPVIKQEAKAFLDWAISDEAMKLYAKYYPVTAVQTDAPVLVGYPKNAESLLIENDFDWAAKHRRRILEEWSKRYEAGEKPNQ